MEANENMEEKTFEKFEEVLKAADAQAKKADEITKELGTSLGGSTSGVMEKIEKMAKERVEKSGGKLTVEEAIDKITDENPDLYAELEKEQSA
jgi:hypothetical protein